MTNNIDIPLQNILHSVYPDAKFFYNILYLKHDVRHYMCIFKLDKEKLTDKENNNKYDILPVGRFKNTFMLQISHNDIDKFNRELKIKKILK